MMTAVDTVTFVLECVGIASFSASGTILAIKKRMDVFGALILAMITAFGGGLMRDLVIGVHPPKLFATQEYAVLAAIGAGVSLLLFLLSFFGNVAVLLTEHAHNVFLEATDTVGLALFCVLGVDSALASAPQCAENTMLLIFCGCITGVGGGVLRDVLSAQIPTVFRKHIYLIPALLGSTLYVLMSPYAARLPSILFSAGSILLIRVLAIRFRWNLPTPFGKMPPDGAKKEV